MGQVKAHPRSAGRGNENSWAMAAPSENGWVMGSESIVSYVKVTLDSIRDWLSELFS